MDLLAKLLTVTLQPVDEGVAVSSVPGAALEVLPRQPLRWRLTLSFENEDGSRSAAAAAFLAEVGECDMHEAWCKLFSHLLLTPSLTLRRGSEQGTAATPAAASSSTAGGPPGETAASDTTHTGGVARFDFGPVLAPPRELALASSSPCWDQAGPVMATADATDDAPPCVLTGPTRALTAIETTVTPVFAATRMGGETGSPVHSPRVAQETATAGAGGVSAMSASAHELPAAVTSVFYFDFTVPDVPPTPDEGTASDGSGPRERLDRGGGRHTGRDQLGAPISSTATPMAATMVELVFTLLVPASGGDPGASMAASPQTASPPSFLVASPLLNWPSDARETGCVGEVHRMYAVLARGAAEARGAMPHAVPAWLALPAIPIGACSVPLLLRRALCCHSVTCPLGNDQLLLSLNITNRSHLPIVLHGANFDLHATELAGDDVGRDADGRVEATAELWSEHRPGPRRVDMRTIDLLTKVVTVTPMVVSDDRPPFTLYPQETYSFQFVLQVLPQLCYLLNPHSLEHIYRQMHVCAPAEELPGGSSAAAVAAVPPAPALGAAVVRDETPSSGTRPAGTTRRGDEAEAQAGVASSASAMLPVRDCYGAPVTAAEILAVLSAAYTSYLFVYYYTTLTSPPPLPSAGRRSAPVADSAEARSRCRRLPTVAAPTAPQGGSAGEINGLHLRHAARWSFGVMK